MIRIFEFLLRQQGIHKVFKASRGDQVMALVRQHHPDLVLLDMMLPEVDGLTLLHELKADKGCRNIPVIVVSARESQEQVHSAMEAGAIDYVIKPFEPMELGVRIRQFFDTLGSTSSPHLGAL
jgi:DNA-binding response OmpR family regulator